MDDILPYFEIREADNSLKIELIDLSFPDTELDWDNNWIKVKVFAKAGAFYGQYRSELMTVDFESFRQSMEKLYDNLNGYATFEGLEGDVTIKVKGDGIGHFTANCKCMDFPGTGNTLNFEIYFDQTEITLIVNQLSEICKVFPVSGDLEK